MTKAPTPPVAGGGEDAPSSEHVEVSPAVRAMRTARMTFAAQELRLISALVLILAATMIPELHKHYQWIAAVSVIVTGMSVMIMSGLAAAAGPERALQRGTPARPAFLDRAGRPVAGEPETIASGRIDRNPPIGREASPMTGVFGITRNG